MLTLALRLHAFIDQDFPFPYIRDLNPWYRFPLGVLNFGFLLIALWGLVTGLRARHVPPFPLLALLVILAGYVAVYLPTTIENRYGMPGVLLVLPGFALGLRDIQVRWSARSRTLLTGAVILAGLVAGGLVLSEWVRDAGASSAGVVIPVTPRGGEPEHGTRPLSGHQRSATHRAHIIGAALLCLVISGLMTWGCTSTAISPSSTTITPITCVPERLPPSASSNRPSNWAGIGRTAIRFSCRLRSGWCRKTP